MMKRRYTALGFTLLPFVFFLLSCDPSVFAPPASARFTVGISGYTAEGDTSISVTLDLEGEPHYVSKSASTGGTDRGEILFSDLETGSWQAEITFLDGTSLVGTYLLSVTVDSGAAVTVGISGDYSPATGAVTFSHTVSTEGTSVLTFTDVNAVIAEERRMWDDSSTDPVMWTQIVAGGDFSCATGGNAVFPDGSVVTLSTGKSFHYFYGINDSDAWAAGTPYDGTIGTYSFTLVDHTEAAAGTSCSVDIDLSGVSVPDITFPGEGEDLGAGGAPITIDWTMSNISNVANIYVFVIEEGATMFDSAELLNTAITYTTVPTTVDNVEYEILVLALDRQLDPLVFSAITTNASNYYDVIDYIMRDYTAGIDYIGAARVNVTG